jgi:DNA polymerase-3 subunit gamma/tau
MLQLFHRIALVQQIPSLPVFDFDAETIAQLASKLDAEDVQLFYQIALLGQKDLALAPDPKSGFEMLLLRMLVFKPAVLDQTAATVRLGSQSVVPDGSDPQQRLTAGQSPALAADGLSLLPATVHDDWTKIIAELKINGLTKELANNCVLIAWDDKTCRLNLDPLHKHLLTHRAYENLQKALQTYRKAALKLVIAVEALEADTPAALVSKDRQDRQQAAVEAVQADETIQALKEHFGARVLPGTIEPV